MNKLLSDLVNKIKNPKEVNPATLKNSVVTKPNKKGDLVTVFGFEFSIVNETRQIVETKMFGAVSEDEAEAISIARNDAEKDLLPGYTVEYTGKFIKQQTVIRKVDESLLNNPASLENVPGQNNDLTPGPSPESRGEKVE